MTKFRNFVSPHVHIQSLDSASTPAAFVKREKQLGTGHITVTDHGTLVACRKVYDLGKKAGLVPIIGLEGYFYDENCPVLKSFGEDPANYIGSYFHVTLLFQDQQAYETGVRLISKADDRAVVVYGERKPPFTWADLEELGQQNVVVGSGCLGGMVQDHMVKHSRFDIATAYYEKLRSTFKPGNFFVEVFPHRITHDWTTGVYLTFADGTIEKIPNWKNLHLDVGEKELLKIKAEDLAKSRKKKYGTLMAVMDNRVWVIRPEPKEIVKVESKSEFVVNECTPLAPDGDLQWMSNRGMLLLAKKYGDPIIVSDDSHFADPEDKIVQDVKLSAMTGGNWRFYGSYHRQSSEEAFAYFSKYMNTELKEFEGWVDNSYLFAEKFKDFKFVDRKQLPTKFYPSDTLRHLYTLIKKHGRMDWNSPQMMERLKSEVNLLHFNGTMDFLPYFFNAEGSVSHYEEQGELGGPGRGSAAGMLTAYLLGITHVDPLKYGLSQDRFMTLDRIKSGKLPDIDQDFGNRDLIIDPKNGWLKNTFGDCYAQICTESTLKLRSSVKDVARHVYGKVPSEIEALTKKFQNAPQGITDKNFVFGYYKNDDEDDEWVPGSIESDRALQKYIEDYPEQWAAVQKCLGITRNYGRHASAFVVANEPVSNFIPLTTVSDVKVTQYDMRSVEAVGGIKMDYLTVNSLNDISDCVKLVQKRHYTDEGPQFRPIHVDRSKNYTINGKLVPGIRVVGLGDELYDIWDLPEDQAVFDDICRGKTESVFQFNTSGAKKWLKLFEKSGLVSVEDLAAFTALDRPGPLDYKVAGRHNMMVEYANRANGKAPVGSLPILDRLFPETYGIIVYQEQLQKAFQEIGETTGIQANSFREHIGKKKMELVYKDKELFMPKAIEKLGKEDAEKLWQSMETFGQYGFNKSVDQDTILLVDGKEKPIKDCKAGESIESIDENGKLVETEIVALHDHGDLEAFEIELDDGSKVVCSMNHKFLTAEGMVPLHDILKRDLEILAYENDEKD